jgi:hypothetical protein
MVRSGTRDHHRSRTGATIRTDGDVKPFVQLWFAGNHSDIGGSYPETESRLSDIALRWMIEEATSLPHPLLVNPNSLQLYPSSAGLQHDEVAGMEDTIRSRTPTFLRWATKGYTWTIRHREPVPNATLPRLLESGSLCPASPARAGTDPTARKRSAGMTHSSFCLNDRA